VRQFSSIPATRTSFAGYRATPRGAAFTGSLGPAWPVSETAGKTAAIDPVVARDVVYFGGNNGRLYALNI
jgi:hypothetical protein